jgi:MOSC domain-containing protein YiiM
MMTGTIVQVSISPGGLPKTAIEGGMISALGVEGDLHVHTQHHGGPRKAILLVSAEAIEEMRGRGYPVYSGALGENLTTRGLDYHQLPAGARLRAGGALLEITQPRKPCSALDMFGVGLKDELFDPEVKTQGPAAPRWGLSGLYASVIEPGAVRAGDIIAIVV